jgi:hypothetical protein
MLLTLKVSKSDANIILSFYFYQGEVQIIDALSIVCSSIQVVQFFWFSSLSNILLGGV